MIEPRPYSRSQRAQLSHDPWAAVRRIVAGPSREPLAAMAFSDPALPAGEDGGSCEGILYAAFLTAAASNSVKANEYFCQVLQELPGLPADHEFWISLTAFAANSTASGAARFEEFLEKRGMLHLAALTEPPLPARTNLLVYCVRHNRLSAALEIVQHATPSWNRTEHGVEAWAFRLANLAVLDRAKDDGRFLEYFNAYRELLESWRIEPAERANVAVQITLAMAGWLRARGEEQSATLNYEQAISLVEANRSATLNAAVLAGLWLTLAKYREVLRQFPQAQTCYERCIAAAGSEGSKHDLVAALAGSAALLKREGRHPEAAALYRQRLSLIAGDRSFSEASKISARNQLAVALFASGEIADAQELFDRTIDLINRGKPPNRSMLVPTLLSRADAGLLEFSEEALQTDIRAIIDSPALSIGQCESLLKMAERAARSGRPQLGFYIFSAVSDRARRFAEANPSRAAPLLLSLSDAALRRFGDPTRPRI